MEVVGWDFEREHVLLLFFLPLLFLKNMNVMAHVVILEHKKHGKDGNKELVT